MAIICVISSIEKTWFLHDVQIANENRWKPYAQLEAEQIKRQRKMIKYAYHNIPFYKHHFDAANVDSSKIRETVDLELIPPIAKEDIIRNKEAFYPTIGYSRYHTRNTGGTTDVPLRYRVSYQDRFLAAAISYLSFALWMEYQNHVQVRESISKVNYELCPKI